MTDTSATELAALRNLGPASAAMLLRAGVSDAATLDRLGAVRAFAMVAANEQSEGRPEPSLNLLYALEGALTDQPWQAVARQSRLELLLALDDLRRPVK